MSSADTRTYYDRPVLKEPTWKWYIAAYFFAGGLSAGCSLLSLGAEVTHRPRLARRSGLVAVAAVAAGAVALVADLGRPERALNMLRVAKVTSPMSVGSWLLVGYGPACGTAAACDVLGVLPGVGRAARVGAAVLAPAVASYTGVLVADTSVPAWHEARATLPWLFVAGAAASAGGLGAAVAPIEESAPARRLALLAATAELVAQRVMQAELGPELAEPYRVGSAGRLRRASEILTVAGVVLLTRSRRRAGTAVAGLLVAGGAAASRLAVLHAGLISARDPRYTVGPQRQRLAGTGAASTAVAMAPVAGGQASASTPCGLA